MRPVLLDTGVIVALLDRAERAHVRCTELIGSLAAQLFTCEAVIAESCYLLRDLRGAAEAVLENVASGIFQIAFRLPASATAVRQLMRKYRDQEMDLADACLVHLASELRTGEILTLDSDFDVYRWGANQPFRRLIRSDRTS